MITIFHNPRCSKSREALALVEDYARKSGDSVEIVDYLKTPLTLAQLQALQAMLAVPAAEMVRSGEDEYRQLGLDSAGDEALLEAVAVQPKLLQRPIVASGGRALIARPPEKLHAWFGA